MTDQPKKPSHTRTVLVAVSIALAFFVGVIAKRYFFDQPLAAEPAAKRTVVPRQ